MGFIIFLVVLALVSIILRNASASWSRALAPGNAIRAERKAARGNKGPSNAKIVAGIVVGLVIFAMVL